MAWEMSPMRAPGRTAAMPALNARSVARIIATLAGAWRYVSAHVRLYCPYDPASARVCSAEARVSLGLFTPVHRRAQTSTYRCVDQYGGCGVARQWQTANVGGDRSNEFAAERDRNEAGNDTAGANLHSKRKPAGHDNSDHRRSQSRSRGQENERGRKTEGRHQGQIARTLVASGTKMPARMWNSIHSRRRQVCC